MQERCSVTSSAKRAGMVLLGDGRNMVYIDMFRRNEIMSDFFTVIRKAELE